MKTLIAVLLFLGVTTAISAQGSGETLDGARPGNTDGILQSIENGDVTDDSCR